MTILGGHFAIVLIVASPDDADDLQAALAEATAPFGLTVHVSPAEGGVSSPDATHLLSVYGSDKPGILAGVTEAIATVGANITDLETRLLSAEDNPVYAMVIELVADDSRRLTAAVADVCDTLGVDHTLRTIEAETY